MPSGYSNSQSEMVKIEVDTSSAQIDEGVWSSSDPLLLLRCEFFTITHPWRAEPSNPDPDHELAVFVAEKIGAKITHYDKPEFVEGLVY